MELRFLSGDETISSDCPSGSIDASGEHRLPTLKAATFVPRPGFLSLLPPHGPASRLGTIKSPLLAASSPGKGGWIIKVDVP